MLVIAHRGNNKEAFENSFKAYEKSVECGANRIELDVVLSRDGHAVINHDDHLMHATGKDLFCSQTDRHVIEALRQRGGEKVPFLEEVIERFLPRIEINIEIKGNNPYSAKVVREIIGKHPLRNKIIVSCFSPEPLIYMRDYCPDIRRACLTGDDTIPWPYFSHMAVLNFMHMTSSTIVHPRMELMSDAFMEQCTHRGWQVFTWAPMIGEDIARESWWTMLKTLGVHGHCTNYPSELVQWQKHEEQLNQRMANLLKPMIGSGDKHAN
jgi:glycerophosphoryl diester phosphodiesterase